MFVFGHAGITLGLALLLAEARVIKGRTGANGLPGPGPASPQPSVGVKNKTGGGRSPLTYLAERIDIRLLLIGSLVPDIFDKPIGELIFRQTFSNGQIFSHTLLFLIVVTTGGLVLYFTLHKTWLAAISFGVFTHLVLDAMWQTPRTLFWPLLGATFERHQGSFYTWVETVLSHVVNDPWVFIPEFAGLLVVAWLVWRLARRGTLGAFLKRGQI
jgi:inner membrane protein